MRRVEQTHDEQVHLAIQAAGNMLEHPAIVLPSLDELTNIEGGKGNPSVLCGGGKQTQRLSQAHFGPRIADQRHAGLQIRGWSDIEVGLSPQDRTERTAHGLGDKDTERSKPARPQE
jgi:hypothetical protein